MYKWHHERWLPWPPAALQLLILEEVHLAQCHVGGEKLYHLLAAHYYWPTLRKDCAAYSGRCFECQLSKGRSVGSWQGKLISLPPGPRHTWAIDHITSLGGDKGPTSHVLTMIDCYSKFCILALVDNLTAATTAQVLH